MSLVTGTRLGSYEVLGSLGAGGMGEVYRARDTKLNRDVAIKVLPQGFATDRDRLMRFEREAQTLAALNHSNIAQVFGVIDDPAGLVMEFVDGEDLSRRLARGVIPIKDALAIATQIADALEAAHERGIIHRDLKPANIKLRADGAVKVLDFGLAKAMDPAGAPLASGPYDSPTLTSPAMTELGIILGTAAYMAPEQAKGQVVDKRADIWAFGVVLYEMLTGRALFARNSVAETIGAVVASDPDWTALPANTPRRIRDLLHRLLEKDPRQRLRDIGDARLEIEAASAPDERAADATRSMSRRRSFAIAVVVAVGMLVLGLAAGRWWGPSAHADEQWTAARLGGPRIGWLPRLSPDGNTLAFAALIGGQTQIGVMNPTTGDWSLLTQDRARGALVHLAWARDGSRLYFSRHQSERGDLFTVPALGGEARLVVENATGPEPLPDGSLLFVRLNAEGREQLHRFWPETGRLAPLPVTVYAAFVSSLRAFPDGREAVLFGRPLSAPRTDPLQLLAVDVDSGRTRQLAPWLRVSGGAEDALPVGVSAGGGEVFIVEYSGHSSTLIAVPRDGSAGRRILFTTTQLIFGVDEGAGGRLYVDQADRSIEHLRFSLAGGVPEVLASGLSATSGGGALPLGDARTAYATAANGRFRILAARPREELMPFVETRDQARGPMVRLNDREFAFIGGTEEQPVLAVASMIDGRVIRRVEGTRGRRMTRVAASPDGQTLYFADGGQIWSIPATDGEPRQVAAGDSVAADPHGRFLLIQRQQQDGMQIVRRDQSGHEVRLTFPPDMSVVRSSLWPAAIGRDGRLAVVVGTSDSWFWGPAVFDLNTGRADRVRLDYAGDVEIDLRWDGDRITALARRIEAAVWRFERRAGTTGR